jgi:hypothetical protein
MSRPLTADPCGTPHPRRRAALRAFAVFALSSAALACPDTARTPVSLSAARPVSAAVPPSFELILSGSGFGLDQVKFDVAAGKGSSSSAGLRVELKRQDGTNPTEVRTVGAPRLVSTSELRVMIELSSALAPGIYAVRLFGAGASEPTAELAPAFQIAAGGGVVDDAGLTALDTGVAAPDLGAPAPDAGLGPADATADDDLGIGVIDAGLVGGIDADVADAPIFFDASAPTFPGGFQYRRPVRVDNTSLQFADGATTFRIVVPHQTMVQLGEARADGADLAVHGPQGPVPFQIEDLARLGTNDLALIVLVSSGIAPGGSASYALYSGDPAVAASAGSDGVYTYVQRFAPGAALAGWALNAWANTCFDRVDRGAGGRGGAYCVFDGGQNQRTTLAAAPSSSLVRNQPVEVAFHVGGRMAGNADMLYFAVGDDTTDYVNTTLPATGAYLEQPPTVRVTFQDQNGNSRTETGWRLASAGTSPLGQDLAYQRVRVRLIPLIENPSMHWRFISWDGNTNGQRIGAALDDITVRRVTEPELIVQVGFSERRP